MLRDQLRGKERPKAVEVECPEFPDADGAPAKLLFRSRLTVADVVALAEFDAPFAPYGSTNPLSIQWLTTKLLTILWPRGNHQSRPCYETPSRCARYGRGLP